jgi:hypothetical protein
VDRGAATLTGLWRQCYRWSFGTMQAVWKHKRAIVSRDARQRRIGRRALPYMICCQILLPLVAPLIDLYALYGLVFTDPVRVIGFWLAFNRPAGRGRRRVPPRPRVARTALDAPLQQLVTAS